jgi:hypothetical protein
MNKKKEKEKKRKKERRHGHAENREAPMHVPPSEERSHPCLPHSRSRPERSEAFSG